MRKVRLAVTLVLWIGYKLLRHRGRTPIIGLLWTLSLVFPISVHADVNPRGQFATELGIELPPYHSIAATLGLSYSSHDVSGDAGLGWSLRGTSRILRRSETGGIAQFKDRDTFALDGLELVPCASSQKSPGCRSALQLFGTHLDFFATRVETFQRIQFRRQDATWVIRTKSGTTRKYTTGDGGNSYLLQSIADTHGNEVAYTWSCGDDQNAACVLSRVSYGRVGADQSTVAVLHWESRPDIRTEATSRGTVRHIRRLRSVEVRKAGQLVRAYRLTYAVSGFSGTSVLASFQQFGRDATVDVDGNVLQGATAPLPANILQTPTVGVQGQWQLRATTTAPGALTLGVSARPDPTFGPRDLNWKSEISYYIDDALEVRIRPNGISSGDFSGNGRTELLAWAADTECASVTISLRSGRSVVLPLPRIGPPGGCQARVFVGDFDGDGVDDIAAASKDSLTAALSRGAGAFEITSRAPWSGTNGSCTVSDIDGDGRADIVCRDAIANQIRVYFSRGTSWELGTISTAGPAEPNIVTGAKTWLVGGDVDGDGFPDLVLLEANSQGFKVHVGRSMGDGTLAWQAPIQLNSPLADESDVQLTDIDGDGRADLAITNPNPTFHVYLNKRGAFTQRWQMMPAVTNDLRYVQFVDLDGDAVQILLAEI